MKKFNLKRLTSLVTAASLMVTLSACSRQDNNTNISRDNSSSTIVDTIGTPKNEESLNKEFVFDSEAPIAVPIEEVVLEDGTIGYKMPRFYLPYEVDSSKPMPGMVGVLEITDEYEIVTCGGYRTNPDGTRTELSFDGSIAVYLPYRQAIDYKYNVILQDGSEYTCPLTKVESDTLPEAYSLKEGYTLYTPDVSLNGTAVASVKTDDGSTVYGLEDEEAPLYIGVTDEALTKLNQIDAYEMAVRDTYYEYTETNTNTR